MKIEKLVEKVLNEAESAKTPPEEKKVVDNFNIVNKSIDSVGKELFALQLSLGQLDRIAADKWLKSYINTSKQEIQDLMNILSKTKGHLNNQLHKIIVEFQDIWNKK